MRKHTPGPWNTSKTINDIVIYSDANPNKDIAMVYQYSRGIPKEEAQANANLIKLTPLIPDMVDALFMARRQLLEHYNISENEALRVVNSVLLQLTDLES